MNASTPRHWKNPWMQPTAEQQRVLQSPATALIISALAGTGKTTTLCMKACDLAARLSGTARVLVLAYSRSGVTAIRDRFLKLDAPALAGLEISTLEQLCAQVLREQGDPVPVLADPLKRRFLILQAQQALRLELERHPDAEADSVLERVVDLDAFLALEALAKKKRLDGRWRESGLGLRSFCEEQDIDYGLYRLVRQYERMRVGMNHEPQFYADGDCTYELCRQIDAIDWDQPLQGLQGRYDAVLFDELHDLDESALTVLRKLVQSGNGVFVGAGDFNQHIHEGAFSVFGGAMDTIKNCLPADTEVLSINTTRRFGAEICAALNPLFGVEFAAVPGSSDAYQVGTYDSDADCAQQLVELHAQIANGWVAVHGPKSAHSTLNVVLRNPQDSILLEWVFGHEGVHYGCQGMSPFYLRREVALVLGLMWALQGTAAQAALTPGIVNAALEGVLHFGGRRAPSDSVDPDVLAQGQFDETSWNQLPGGSESPSLVAALLGQPTRMQQYLRCGTLDPRAPARTDACAQVLDLPASVLADAGALCQHAQVRRIFTEAPLNVQERQACLASLEHLAALAQGLAVAEFLGRLSQLAQASIAMYQRKEKVTLRLLSVEACKGREFTFVAVPFVERGRFPAPAAPEQAYRERNMLYVAMTRARAALWLMESAQRPVTPGPV